MNHSLILKNIITPIIEKYNEGTVVAITDQQWALFANYFIDFDKGESQTINFINQLNLENTSQISKELPEIYTNFIAQLAEEHVIGNQSSLIDKLIDSDNIEFKERVLFFKNLKNVVTKLERKRIKEELPILYEKLEYQIDETLLEKVALKKGREDLKKQFKKWDAELVEEESEKKNNKITKVFQLSYFKYAVAACFLLGFSVWFFNKSTSNENVLMFPMESLAEVSSVQKSMQIIENGSLGFGSLDTKITIIENQQFKRIQSIEKILKEHKNIPKTNLNLLNNELAKLKEQEQYYTFFENKLTIQTIKPNNLFQMVYLDSLIYFLKNKQVYPLKISKKPIQLQLTQDSLLIDKIDDVLFKNNLPTLQDE